MSKKELKIIPKDQRKGKQERVFSTKFMNNMITSDINVYVPWEDFLSLKKRYVKLHKRYMKTFK